MKPGDLVKLTDKSKSDWQAIPPIVVSQFGILIEEIEVERPKWMRGAHDSGPVPGWLVSTTGEGLVRRPTSRIVKVRDPSEALPDLIAARDLLDKKIKELQEQLSHEDDR
jgi:hypothetical protein